MSTYSRVGEESYSWFYRENCNIIIKLTPCSRLRLNNNGKLVSFPLLPVSHRKLRKGTNKVYLFMLAMGLEGNKSLLRVNCKLYIFYFKAILASGYSEQFPVVSSRKLALRFVHFPLPL